MWIVPTLLVLSMDWNSLLGWSKATQEMAQYPDARLYKAASKLKPEERPTVPVSLYADPEKLYQEYLQPIGGGRPTVGNIGFTSPDKKRIFINGNYKKLGNSSVLAAKLAHEQVHVGQEVQDEIPAYEKDLEVLKRLVGRNDGDLIATQDYLGALKRFRSVGK